MRWLLWLSLWSCVFLAQAEPVPLVTPVKSTFDSAISQRFGHFIDLHKVNSRLAQSTAVKIMQPITVFNGGRIHQI
jgi:hypothetical protein